LYSRAMENPRLRAWGGSVAMRLAFPLAALVAALLVFATTALTAGLIIGLVLALLPWALLAGNVRVGPWAMFVIGVGVPGVLVAVNDAPGAIFLALLALAWIAAGAESFAAEIMAAAASTIVIPVMYVGGEWGDSGQREGFVFFATGGLITLFIGRILRRERQLVGALTDAQNRLKDAAAAAERQRIAHDVHDVVGHSLSVVLLNVAGARRVLERDPTAAAEALDRAEQVGRDSLQNVRSIVGLLRQPGEAETKPPMPGADDIAGLVQTSAEAGLSVRVEVTGELAAVDPYAGLAAFRLVQEAISNVQHHAPESEVVVRIAEDREHLRVSVHNGPVGMSSSPASRGGTGLDGMRQRFAALGGTVSAGPDGDGWLVEASIPLQRTDADAAR